MSAQESLFHDGDKQSDKDACDTRSDARRDLFWKQIDRAAKDVAAWPDYLKRAFGVKS